MRPLGTSFLFMEQIVDTVQDLLCQPLDLQVPAKARTDVFRMKSEQWVTKPNWRNQSHEVPTPSAARAQTKIC